MILRVSSSIYFKLLGIFERHSELLKPSRGLFFFFFFAVSLPREALVMPVGSVDWTKWVLSIGIRLKSGIRSFRVVFAASASRRNLVDREASRGSTDVVIHTLHTTTSYNLSVGSSRERSLKFHGVSRRQKRLTSINAADLRRRSRRESSRSPRRGTPRHFVHPSVHRYFLLFRAREKVDLDNCHAGLVDLVCKFSKKYLCHIYQTYRDCCGSNMA